ncbi:hypothetical protein [Roseateles asaccharophilus]|uniref:C-type lysozyme inhibitor domain-containing protein n=1 Tax=Roseateles asaccharophilus TaxID=582607 RepID=A0ABU2A8C3_9BURK|nr:hypothetical protein [Roseateles asaccharophilus]MDR7333385.1 hypothetical protein [Roseateles asaccharophilus]
MRTAVVLTLLAAGAASAQVGTPPPTLLVCSSGESLTASVSHDATGAPLRAGVSVTSGTRECDLQTQGAAAAADGSWRFEWTDAVVGNIRYRATLRRAGTGGFTLALQPARCGGLALPASVTLAPAAPGCEAREDRDGAFLLFWRQLRDALTRRDGELLQRLALQQPSFIEGPDLMKAPASLLRHSAACLATVTTTDGRSDLGQLLKATDSPRLDMPPLSRRGAARVSVGGAMTAAWTPQGWRIESLNADRASFAGCKPTN